MVLQLRVTGEKRFREQRIFKEARDRKDVEEG